MCTPSNTYFLGPTLVHFPNGISIGSDFCTAHRIESRYFKMAALSPSKLPVHMWDVDRIEYMVCWVHPQPKRHIDRFSRFCRADDRVRQTDRPTDHANPSVTIGRIDVVLRCGLKHVRGVVTVVTAFSLLGLFAQQPSPVSCVNFHYLSFISACITMTKIILPNVRSTRMWATCPRLLCSSSFTAKRTNNLSSASWKRCLLLC